MPAITIVVPIYNTEQYLPCCIDSILSQSFTDFELLLIDDGSTDGSSQICDSYAEKDNRIRVFHKENGGVSSARNLGLDNAKGEWVTFVDSDDWIEDDYFQIPFDEKVDLYVQNWTFANGDKTDFYNKQFIGSKDYNAFLKENIHTDTFRTVCCFFLKKKIIRDNCIRFDVHHRLGEDTLFVMDYYKYAKSIQIMDNSYYKYNRQENWGGKYSLSWEETESYLKVFWKKYEALSIDSPRLLSFVFSFFFKRTMNNEKPLNYKWKLSEPVLCYKKTLLPVKSLSFKVRFYLAKMLSLIIRFGKDC